MPGMIAIITARSGSKGLKDKNIKELGGKPLIAYAIESAIQSGVFDEIMVSTDSEKYAKIAKEYGASVPFLRSDATASDTASSWDAIREILEKYRQMGREFDAFCCLQPTSPFRTAGDIASAYELFQKAGTAVVSVCETEDSPDTCSPLPSDNSLDGFARRENDVRRQERRTYYRVNGAIYMVNIKEFEKDDFLYREGSYAYVMDRRSSVDIDDEFDFKMAEFIMKDNDRL